MKQLALLLLSLRLQFLDFLPLQLQLSLKPPHFLALEQLLLDQQPHSVFRLFLLLLLFLNLGSEGVDLALQVIYEVEGLLIVAQLVPQFLVHLVQIQNHLGKHLVRDLVFLLEVLLQDQDLSTGGGQLALQCLSSFARTLTYDLFDFLETLQGLASLHLFGLDFLFLHFQLPFFLSAKTAVYPHLLLDFFL